MRVSAVAVSYTHLDVYKRQSIYSVNGELAKLENVPDVIFSISDVDTVTVAVLNERRYLLNELSKTTPNITRYRVTHPPIPGNDRINKQN